MNYSYPTPIHLMQWSGVVLYVFFYSVEYLTLKSPMIDHSFKKIQKSVLLSNERSDFVIDV